MCIIFFHFCESPGPDGYRLIIASNRDEFYYRPTTAAKFWDKNPNIIAGMDMEPGREGGTWLGITRDGKFAAITNYRQAPKFIDLNARGRGHLVPEFLQGEESVCDYLRGVSSNGDEYNGFNLLVGNLHENNEQEVGWYCNVEDKQVKLLSPGTHVLSNRVLDYSWPKMVYGKERFADILAEDSTKQELIDKLLVLLSERQRHFPGEDDKCFIGPQDEGGNLKYINGCRSIFVNLKEAQYGTRTNTVILVDAAGHATYLERTMQNDVTDPDEADWLVNTFELDIEKTDRGGASHAKSKTADSKQQRTSKPRNGSAKENLMNGREHKGEEVENGTTQNGSEHLEQDKPRKRPFAEGTATQEPAKKVAIQK